MRDREIRSDHARRGVETNDRIPPAEKAPRVMTDTLSVAQEYTQMLGLSLALRDLSLLVGSTDHNLVGRAETDGAEQSTILCLELPYFLFEIKEGEFKVLSTILETGNSCSLLKVFGRPFDVPSLAGGRLTEKNLILTLFSDSTNEEPDIFTGYYQELGRPRKISFKHATYSQHDALTRLLGFYLASIETNLERVI
jgi:hypothetical protein